MGRTWSSVILLVFLYSSEANFIQTDVPRSTMTSQFCYWTVQSPCLMDCMSGTINDINRVVSDRWQEIPQCHSDGLTLVLGSSIKYSLDWTMPSGWFTADVQVTELVVDCRNTDTIEDGAFNATAFQTVEKLTLRWALSGNMLTAQSLRGLSQLKILHILDNSMEKIRSGTLNVVAGTLEELIFQESSSYNSLIVIDGLTGGNPLLQLTKVKIQRNMNNTITNGTFTGLVKVTGLDLSYCQIEVIAAGAFTPISKTIQELNLRNNKLIQIPVGLLDGLVINTALKIYLNDNRWQCDCALCYLRWLIRNGKLSNPSNLICRLPLQFRDDEIGEVDFCPDPQCDEYNPIATPDPPPDHTLPPTEDQQYYRQQCTGSSNYTTEANSPENDFVMLPKYSHQFKFLRTSNSTVAVLVESRICNMFLLWFDSTREVFRTPTLSESQAHGCTYLADTLNLTTNFQQVIVINTLQANVPYIFCLMERTHLTVSPLNCIPYMNMVAPEVHLDDNNEVWLLGSDKTMRIVFIVAIMFGSVMVGFLVAYFLLWRQTKQLEACSRIGLHNNHSPSFDGTTESPDCGKPIDGKSHVIRRGSEGSTGSAQSYALAVNLSRFEIVQMQMQKKIPENQYYLENIPYVMAPAPPVTDVEPIKLQDENIYAVIEPSEGKLCGAESSHRS